MYLILKPSILLEPMGIIWYNLSRDADLLGILLIEELS